MNDPPPLPQTDPSRLTAEEYAEMMKKALEGVPVKLWKPKTRVVYSNNHCGENERKSKAGG